MAPDPGDVLCDDGLLRSALDQLLALRDALIAAEAEQRDQLDAIPPALRPQARNLVHYVAFRQFDLRPLQAQLSGLGLSSLGRSEAHVLAAIASVTRLLQRLLGLPVDPPTSARDAQQALRAQTESLFGPSPRCAIMVTLPTDAASDETLVRSLLSAGMRVARINCAHDDPETWIAASSLVRRAARELDRPCRILFDLPGPKLRTLATEEDGVIPLQPGDTLLLTADGQPGRPARRASDGKTLEPARIACALPLLIDALVEGAPVHFDDGKIGSEVVTVRDGVAHLRITHTAKQRGKLRSEKGINVPETPLEVPALDQTHIAALALAARHADMVGLSFARSRDDVRQLHQELARIDADALGVVLKIETRAGFEQLPAMLLEALRRPPVGVMIARGDLAVECGFERLAELQEEILWVCEAARVPAIWATQVLERLTKRGRVTRAEITDAAMAERAECVMLNKGPHIVRAVRTLDDILTRMQGHQHKKSARLRALRSLRLP